MQELMKAHPALAGSKMIITREGEPLLVPPELFEELVKWIVHDGPPPAYWKELKTIKVSSNFVYPIKSLWTKP